MRNRNNKLKSDTRVLIVGCGEIGSRHLQAIASLPIVSSVEIVDPNPQSLELGKARLLEIPDLNTDIEFKWLDTIDKATVNGDLCIVCTKTDIRPHILHQVSTQLGYFHFLVEKMVAQSISEYESILDLCQKRDIQIWVNCKTRAYPFHKRAKLKVKNEPITLSVHGSNNGLATNGIHAVDLFLFYDGSSKINSAGSNIDPTLHKSKRGTGFFDLSGTIHGFTDKGSQLMISYSQLSEPYEHITFSSNNYRCVVDHMNHWAVESTPDLNWDWQAAKCDENLMISNMTKHFASSIITSNTCDLPDLEQSFPSHRFILDELLPHFTSLMGHDIRKCPIT